MGINDSLSANERFVMDIKLDGERMLCHKLANGSVKWFTRRANEYSHLYGPVMNDLIKSHVNVESCILDGEMVRECLPTFYVVALAFKTVWLIFGHFADNDSCLCAVMVHIMFLRA